MSKPITDIGNNSGEKMRFALSELESSDLGGIHSYIKIEGIDIGYSIVEELEKGILEAEQEQSNSLNELDVYQRSEFHDHIEIDLVTMTKSTSLSKWAMCRYEAIKHKDVKVSFRGRLLMDWEKKYLVHVYECYSKNEDLYVLKGCLINKLLFEYLNQKTLN